MRITIGTEAKQILAANPKRKRWELQMIPQSIEAGNTGYIYIGKGYPPSTNSDSMAKDAILSDGASVGDNVDALLEKCPYTGAVWAVATIAAQVCTLFEENITENGNSK
ncbi:MAG TPA: hypothetical protein P5056_02880 [Candidatus Paceibacterota bacterium]|nr:hypothetical protein [Candidatus Paceibacterota bacterium]